ncbi:MULTISPECIES: GGDEF domain-containing response regulator [Haloarcula]|uniref:PAS domain-containing response regulator n=1 Tax=Haloarcula TaxID=2237 RepID=UPI0023EB7A67|nr:GGDEF domain-containing response regulator [Halomicroarcula sp. XH51]
MKRASGSTMEMEPSIPRVDGRPGDRTATAPIRVLHVDDDPQILDLTASCLRRENDDFEVVCESSTREGLDRLERETVDCVVSDYDMPGTDGLEFLELVREAYPEMPFILYTGKGSEEIASDAISAGVTDYLQKGRGVDQYTVLANRIANAVERRRSLAALQKSEAHLARAQQIADLGSWTWDIETGGLYWSDQIYRIAGVEPDTWDATYDAFLELVHPDDRDAVTTAVDRALAGDSAYDIEHRIVRPDGDVRTVHERAEIARDEDGDPVAMNGTVQDVTDRVSNQHDLKAFREAVEHAGHSIYWTDPDGRIEYVNPAFEESTGYTAAEVMGANPRILKSGAHDEAFYADLWETILDGETWEGWVVNERKSGERYVVDQTITPVTDSSGDIKRFVAVNTDATSHSTRD